MNEKILLVEDAQALGVTLSQRLRNEGYKVEIVSNGVLLFQEATARLIDLIILDATLTGLSRIELCRHIREAGLTNPVLLLTAGNQTAQTVLGLRMGADDCVKVPFEIAEVLARVEALLRRGHLRMRGVHRFGVVRLDIPGTAVKRGGQPVFLTKREFELLHYFVDHAKTPLARNELLREVWGYEHGTFTRTLDVYIARLRRKLEANPKCPELILTVPGIGYRFGK